MKVLNMALIAMLVSVGVCLGLYAFDANPVALGIGIGLGINCLIVSFMRYVMQKVLD